MKGDLPALADGAFPAPHAVAFPIPYCGGCKGLTKHNPIPEDDSTLQVSASEEMKIPFSSLAFTTQFCAVLGP